MCFRGPSRPRMRNSHAPPTPEYLKALMTQGFRAGSLSKSALNRAVNKRGAAGLVVLQRDPPCPAVELQAEDVTTFQ